MYVLSIGIITTFHVSPLYRDLKGRNVIKQIGATTIPFTSLHCIKI